MLKTSNMSIIQTAVASIKKIKNNSNNSVDGCCPIMDAGCSFSLAPRLTDTQRVLSGETSLFLPITTIWSPGWDFVNMNLRFNAQRWFVTVVFCHFAKFHYLFSTSDLVSSSSPSVNDDRENRPVLWRHLVAKTGSVAAKSHTCTMLHLKMCLLKGVEKSDFQNKKMQFNDSRWMFGADFRAILSQQCRFSIFF